MISAIPGLPNPLASWRPPDKAPLKDTFAHVLEKAATSGKASEPGPLPTYEVQPGDNLWGIAKKFGLARPWELARLNGLENPDLLKVGQVLTLPRENRPASIDTLAADERPGQSPEGPDTAKKNAALAKPPAKNGKGRVVTASWYGPRHHGKLMANGQPFDMHADTVAHPTLPLGTRLRLTNPANGRAAEVRVTDRGPFIPGRNLDLSYGVARKLGVVQAGVSKLYLEIS